MIYKPFQTVASGGVFATRMPFHVNLTSYLSGKVPRECHEY